MCFIRPSLIPIVRGAIEPREDQFGVKLYPGFSGGPLVNAEGRWWASTLEMSRAAGCHHSCDYGQIGRLMNYLKRDTSPIHIWA